MSVNWYVLHSKLNKEEFLWKQLSNRKMDAFYSHIRVQTVNPCAHKIKSYFPSVAPVAAYGYLPVKLNEGKALLDAALSLKMTRVPDHFGTDGRSAASHGGILVSAASLFDNATTLPLAEYVFPSERLTLERAKITAFDSLIKSRRLLKVQTSCEQSAAMNSIDAWRAQYLKIVRVTLHYKK